MPDALFDRHRQAFPPPERGLESSHDSPFVGCAVMLRMVKKIAVLLLGQCEHRGWKIGPLLLADTGKISGKVVGVQFELGDTTIAPYQAVAQAQFVLQYVAELVSANARNREFRVVRRLHQLP
jgi:hypothetical protein